MANSQQLDLVKVKVNVKVKVKVKVKIPIQRFNGLTIQHYASFPKE